MTRRTPQCNLWERETSPPARLGENFHSWHSSFLTASSEDALAWPRGMLGFPFAHDIAVDDIAGHHTSWLVIFVALPSVCPSRYRRLRAIVFATMAANSMLACNDDQLDTLLQLQTNWPAEQVLIISSGCYLHAQRPAVRTGSVVVIVSGPTTQKC